MEEKAMWQERAEELFDENEELKKKIEELSIENKKLIETNLKCIKMLTFLRNHSSLWRWPRAGGQDKYAGLPGGMRHIDELLKSLEQDSLIKLWRDLTARKGD